MCDATSPLCVDYATSQSGPSKVYTRYSRRASEILVPVAYNPCFPMRTEHHFKILVQAGVHRLEKMPSPKDNFLVDPLPASIYSLALEKYHKINKNPPRSKAHIRQKRGEKKSQKNSRQKKDPMELSRSWLAIAGSTL